MRWFAGQKTPGEAFRDVLIFRPAATMTMAPLLRAAASRPGGRPMLGLLRRHLPIGQSPARYLSADSTKQHQQHRDDHKHCVELVQSRDLDGYLCGLLMPSTAARDAYFAIRAFNVGVASVKDGGGLGRRRPRSEASVSSADASAFGEQRQKRPGVAAGLRGHCSSLVVDAPPS